MNPNCLGALSSQKQIKKITAAPQNQPLVSFGLLIMIKICLICQHKNKFIILQVVQLDMVTGKWQLEGQLAYSRLAYTTAVQV